MSDAWRVLRRDSTCCAVPGTDIKVQQELLRHANIQTTMNIYTQAVSDQKRVANSKVVEMVLSGKVLPVPANGSRIGADCRFASFPQTA